MCKNGRFQRLSLLDCVRCSALLHWQLLLLNTGNLYNIHYRFKYKFKRLVKLTVVKPRLVVEVVYVFAQHEVSSDVETSANDVHFPVSETDSHMQPVVFLERMDLTR